MVLFYDDQRRLQQMLCPIPAKKEERSSIKDNGVRGHDEDPVRSTAENS